MGSLNVSCGGKIAAIRLHRDLSGWLRVLSDWLYYSLHGPSGAVAIFVTTQTMTPYCPESVLHSWWWKVVIASRI